DKMSSPPNSNLFRVVSERDLTELLNDHTHQLVTVVFVLPPDQQINFKRWITSYAKENKDNFFVYVDMTEYEVSDDKYTKEMQTSKTLFYLNNELIAQVKGTQISLICDTFNRLRNLMHQRLNLQKSQSVHPVKSEDSQQSQAMQYLL